MKRFRIVPSNDNTHYEWRIDQRSSILFGLIKSWERIGYFPTFKEAFMYIINNKKWNTGGLLIEDKQGHPRFYRKSNR